MIHLNVFFQVSSETNLQHLMKLNEAVVRRINFLQRSKQVPVIVANPDPVEKPKQIEETKDESNN